MQIKKILSRKVLAAAAAATVLSLAGVSAADAAPFHGAHGYHGRPVRVERVERRVVEHRVVFETLRTRHIRYVGTPYFVRGHYVVKTFGPRGVRFVEVNPHSGAFIGFIRL